MIAEAYGLLDDPGRVEATSNVADAMDERTRNTLDKMCVDLCALINVPVAAVTLLGSQRQLVLGACGMSHAPVDRDHSFCIFVAASGTSFEMSDIEEPEIAKHPGYTKRNVRAYLGKPLVVRKQTVGALCAVDWVPREWSELDHLMLTNYAAHASSILEEKT